MLEVSITCCRRLMLNNVLQDCVPMIPQPLSGTINYTEKPLALTMSTTEPSIAFIEKDGDSDAGDEEWFQDELEDDDPTVFKVRDPLDPPKARHYMVQELHGLIHEGLVDLNPTYQRDVVWPETKQIKLIDSIFRNFYIPPVIFAVQKNDDGTETLVCVDGKQRLTSIQKFIDGQIPHRDAVTGKCFWFQSPDHLRASRLEVPDFYKNMFANKEITCVQYGGLTAMTEHEIFQRVQLGMPLTAAEKLQAIASPTAQWISSLQVQYAERDDGLTSTINWDTKRSRDFQNFAAMVYVCHGLPNRLSPGPTQLEKWLNGPGENVENTFKTLIGQTLHEMWLISGDPALNEGFRKIDKRVAPVEFIFIGVLLYVMRDFPRSVRSRRVYDLRTHLRKKFADIRTNARVVKAIWDFLESVVANTHAASYIGGTSVATGRTRRANVGQKKRGRDEDSDEEYVPTGYKSSKGRGGR